MTEAVAEPVPVVRSWRQRVAMPLYTAALHRRADTSTIDEIRHPMQTEWLLSLVEMLDNKIGVLESKLAKAMADLGVDDKPAGKVGRPAGK